TSNFRSPLLTRSTESTTTGPSTRTSTARQSECRGPLTSRAARTRCRATGITATRARRPKRPTRGARSTPIDTGLAGTWLLMKWVALASTSTCSRRWLPPTAANREGMTVEASWRSLERYLAEHAKTPSCSVDRVEVVAERDRDGIPTEVLYRWIETKDGVS